jgi:hypothetical protein
MEIVPLWGISNTKLGDSRSETRGILGNPDQVKKATEQPETIGENWTYRLMRLELEFHAPNDFRLSKITSRHPNTLVLGFNPIGLNERYLLQKFPDLKTIESNAKVQVFFDDILKISFTLVRGKTESVTVHLETGENTGHIIWPVRS